MADLSPAAAMLTISIESRAVTSVGIGAPWFSMPSPSCPLRQDPHEKNRWTASFELARNTGVSLGLILVGSYLRVRLLGAGVLLLLVQAISSG